MLNRYDTRNGDGPLVLRCVFKECVKRWFKVADGRVRDVFHVFCISYDEQELEGHGLCET